MFLKFTEVYEDVSHYNNAIGKKFWLTRDVTINIEQVSMMRGDDQLPAYIRQNKDSCKGLLNEDNKFTRLTITKGMTSSDILVLGSLEDMTAFINRDGFDKKRVLKG